MADKEYIEREAAKHYAKHAYAKGLNVLDYLDEVPAADVRPVVRGRWTESYDKWTPTKKCSSCGSHFWQFAMKDVGVGDKVAPVLNFCPNCGADMREAGE